MKKFRLTEEALLAIFAQSRDVFRHRFTSRAGKRRAALLMYSCEAVLKRDLGIPPSAYEKFPQEAFSSELLLPAPKVHTETTTYKSPYGDAYWRK